MKNEKQEILKGDYSTFVNFIEKNIITICGKRTYADRMNVVAYLIGYYGYINEVIFDMINKAYCDGIID